MDRHMRPQTSRSYRIHLVFFRNSKVIDILKFEDFNITLNQVSKPYATQGLALGITATLSPGSSQCQGQGPVAIQDQVPTSTFLTPGLCSLLGNRHWHLQQLTFEQLFQVKKHIHNNAGQFANNFFFFKSQKTKELMKGHFEHKSNATQKHLFYVS